MKLTYQYRFEDEISEPVEFPVLVQMVRDEKLLAGDLVKPEWKTDWHPAIELVGLFYMAGRNDAIQKWEEEQAEKSRLEAKQANEEDDELEGVICIDDLGEMLDTADDFLDLENDAKDSQGQEKEFEKELAFTARLTRRISHTIAEAMGIASKQDSEQERLSVSQRISSSFGDNILHKVFRWGTTLAAANLTVFAILSWSKMELQRFPDQQILKLGGKIFPFWGWCSPNEYILLLINTTLVCGLLAYFGAMMLESFAED